WRTTTSRRVWKREVEEAPFDEPGRRALRRREPPLTRVRSHVDAGGNVGERPAEHEAGRGPPRRNHSSSPRPARSRRRHLPCRDIDPGGAAAADNFTDEPRGAE